MGEEGCAPGVLRIVQEVLAPHRERASVHVQVDHLRGSVAQRRLGWKPVRKPKLDGGSERLSLVILGHPGQTQLWVRWSARP